MSNQTDLCNLALAEISDQRITSTSEDSTPARACALLFRPTVEAVLMEASWRSARGRQTLVRNATAPEFGWDYSYALPADFMRLVSLNDQSADDNLDPDCEIEGNALLTDETAAAIVYVRNPFANPAEFSVVTLSRACKDCIVALLASKLANQLRQNPQLSNRFYEMYERLLAENVLKDGVRSRPRILDIRTHSRWRAARY
jgi:hypothetical protein